jgi:site-specific DNA-methyltransferase (cytosine-N4-specific)
MVADELATALAERFVPIGASVLDPFCGSGRLLVAAARKAQLCVGSDLNPLAYLLTRAKFAHPRASTLPDLLAQLEHVRRTKHGEPAKLRGNRKVEWFAPAVLSEIKHLLGWLNRTELNYDERVLVGACLSAAVRDASYISKAGWKLHRAKPENRQSLSLSECFARRLKYCVEELSHGERPAGRGRVFISDARKPISDKSPQLLNGPFDVILTSPPYGDSTSTVQYGAASELSLDFVSRISGLQRLYSLGCSIDSSCLGGMRHEGLALPPDLLRPFWKGAANSRAAVSVKGFLEDFGMACASSVARLKRDGVFVLVLGRRTVGGHRLLLDDYAESTLTSLGLRHVDSFTRTIKNKRIPQRINRYARASSIQRRLQGSTRTMSEEQVLVFRKG